MKNELLKILSDVKLFLFDLDGVLIHNEDLTDSQTKLIIEEIKNFSNELSVLGLRFGIVTARNKDELITELEKSGNIILIHSTLEKVNAVTELLDRLKINFSNVFYAGDEVLDLPLLSKVGFSASPSWAKRDVKRSVKYIFKGNNIKSILSELLDALKNIRN